MIKRKWPKTIAELGFHSSNTPVAARPRASLSLPRESDKERPGSPPGPRAGRQPSSGGCRPGPPAVRGGVRASTGPRVGLALPGVQLQRGGRQPSPPAVRGGIWASATPWVGCRKWGPKGSLEPSTNLVAGQAAGPLGKPGASQNCPRPYQGESGGLEPSTKPVAGQAAAPPAQPVALEGSRALPGQSLATFF